MLRKGTDLEAERGVRATLRLVPGLGSLRLRELIAVFGSARAAWEAPPEAFSAWGKAEWVLEMLRWEKRMNWEAVAEELRRKGIRSVMPEEDHYPRLLAELADAPPLLYYRGSLRGELPALAFVGSRQATAYGKAAAEFLARGAAERGVVVVSGLARGIDTAAHKGALAVSGVTWAFLGSGVDIIYPKENLRIANEILEQGALISEFVPGTSPQPTHFPARNRLLSGCARGVVVVEAAMKSGAMITVDFALEQGREVFAVPGPIFSEFSKGANELLRQGARLIDKIEDIWTEFPDFQVLQRRAERLHAGESGLPAGAGAQVEASEFTPVQGAAELSREQESLLALLSDIPLHIDQIMVRASVDPTTVPLLLLELQLTGRVMQLPGQRYVLSRY